MCSSDLALYHGGERPNQWSSPRDDLLRCRGDQAASAEQIDVQHNVESGSGTSLRLFNTMSRKKEVFKPLNPGKATMYACGPTAFTPPNLAHCRRFVVADLIRRYLEYRGLTVDSYMNYTDLDDNTITGGNAGRA